jgi:hypothetical protein
MEINSINNPNNKLNAYLLDVLSGINLIFLDPLIVVNN